MAEQLGTFALKHTGNTYLKEGDNLVIRAHFEGGAEQFGSGFGTVSATLPIADAGATSGTCTYAGQSFLDEWKLTLHAVSSTGQRILSIGTVNLTTGSFEGELFTDE
jgi:hypothetical protein